MNIYSVKRYKITERLRNAIRNHPYSMRKMEKLLGFSVRKFKRNLSISEDNWNKLNKLLKTNLRLEEIKFNFTKNLGNYSYIPPQQEIIKSDRLAEFIGIMLGDGCVTQNNQIKISFDKRNIKYLIYVEELFKDIFGIKPKRQIISATNQAYLYFYGKEYVNELLRFGLKNGDKIKNQVGIPNWIKENKNYAKRCLRGLIDTDGCIYFSKRDKQTYIKFTSFNKNLLEDFRKTAENLDYFFKSANKQNVCLYKKNRVARFINEIKPFKTSPIK